MAETDPMTSREREVANLVLEGKSNKAIALALRISESTVEFHLKNIYAKLQVRSRVELALKLRESTVAGASELPDNPSRRNLRAWAASFKDAFDGTVREVRVMNAINASERDPATPVTFFEAIRICMTKYADFEGRASRPEFWWFMLFIVLVLTALTYVSETAGAVFLIAVLLPLLAAGARRLHDTGRSGWWQLFLLAPVGGIVILAFLWAEPPVAAQTEQPPAA